MEAAEGGELVQEVGVEAVASFKNTKGSQGLILDILKDVPCQPLSPVG